MHRLTKYWTNPEGFTPERFLTPLDDTYNFIYIPFSVGPRGCIGKHFAFMEMTIILTMISQRYNLFLTRSSSLEMEKTSIHKLNTQQMPINRSDPSSPS